MDGNGTDRVNLVEIQDETREKAIANFEQSLHNAVNVLTTKQMQEEENDKKHEPNEGDDKNKGSKRYLRRRLGFHDFSI